MNRQGIGKSADAHLPLGQLRVLLGAAAHHLSATTDATSDATGRRADSSAAESTNPNTSTRTPSQHCPLAIVISDPRLRVRLRANRRLQRARALLPTLLTRLGLCARVEPRAHVGGTPAALAGWRTSSSDCACGAGRDAGRHANQVMNIDQVALLVSLEDPLPTTAVMPPSRRSVHLRSSAVWLQVLPSPHRNASTGQIQGLIAAASGYPSATGGHGIGTQSNILPAARILHAFCTPPAAESSLCVISEQLVHALLRVAKATLLPHWPAQRPYLWAVWSPAALLETNNYYYMYVVMV